MEYDIGIRLRAARKKLGLTQSTFAEKIGVSDATVSTTESGKTPLTEANLRLICLTFGLNEEWLRHGTGEMFDAHSPNEAELLECFRKLSSAGQRLVLEHLDLMLKTEALHSPYWEGSIAAIQTSAKQNEAVGEKAPHPHDMERA
jgi:transcriptional regulator with XRE-family HTH domain